MRDRVLLEREERVPDESAGFKSSWIEKGRFWTALLIPKFKEQVLQGGVQSVEQVQAVIRSGVEIIISDRLTFENGKVFEVVAVDDSQPGIITLGLKRLRKRGG